jgi:hypothetical protein
VHKRKALDHKEYIFGKKMNLSRNTCFSICDYENQAKNLDSLTYHNALISQKMEKRRLEGCIGFALFHLNQVENLAPIAANIHQTP